MYGKQTTIILTAVASLWASAAQGQIAVPIRDSDDWRECWSICNRSIDMVVRDQVAAVTITDNVVNPCARETEIQYVFPLPPDATVDQFTLVVDGRELTGRILDANEARQIYDDIVRRRRDPGLLEYAGYGFFRSSAFPLPPGRSAELVVHYSVVCKKDGDIIELWYPMASGKFCVEPVEHFEITADIQSAERIGNAYSPSLGLDIDRKSPRHIVASYEARHYRPLADFQLFYDVAREDVGATFLTYWPDRSKDGYYLMMVSPNPSGESETVLPKDIVVVLDRSGSMSGEKIRQARESVRFVLDNLNPRDRFNFVAYNSDVEPCFESLLPASRENVRRAISRLDRIDASGGTNIYHALEVALAQFSKWGRGDHRPAYVIFMTDGLPTVGNTAEADILQNTSRCNAVNVRLFTFGVGYDVNVRLLDNLVNQNHGRSEYVKPNESIEGKVAALYARIKNPFMTDVSVRMEDFGTRDNCPNELDDLFEGDQLVRVGRIYPRDEGTLEYPGVADCSTMLTVTGMVRGEKHEFRYPVTLWVEESSCSYGFVEKLWATRRIGQLLEDIQLHGRVEEVVDELIRLSKQFGIVTPYTSFLADENRDFAHHRVMRDEALLKLKVSEKSITGPQAHMDAAMRAEALQMRGPQPLSSGGYAMQMGATNQRDFESGKMEEINTIRIIGNAALYKKSDTWMTAEAAELDPIRDRARFRVVQRFSDEYFALIQENSKNENSILASQKSGERLAITLRGTLYMIE